MGHVGQCGVEGFGVSRCTATLAMPEVRHPPTDFPDCPTPPGPAASIPSLESLLSALAAAGLITDDTTP